MPREAEDVAELVNNVLKLSRIVRTLTQRAGESVNLAHQAVLFALKRSGPIRASDLASQLCVGNSAMSRQLAELENSGLITREQDSADGRAALVHLSPEGETYLTALQRRRTERMKATLQQFSADELHAFNASLSTLNEHFSAALDTPTGTLKAVAAAERKDA